MDGGTWFIGELRERQSLLGSTKDRNLWRAVIVYALRGKWKGMHLAATTQLENMVNIKELKWFPTRSVQVTLVKADTSFNSNPCKLQQRMIDMITEPPSTWTTPCWQARFIASYCLLHTNLTIFLKELEFNWARETSLFIHLLAARFPGAEVQ